ncbi:lipocalin-like domain-containing protein [Maritalea porphyrae]|uniref:Lipocalin-like domain-containing protein n=1 Tax=Maritalea porphyrae TaxID=880732 RepID=A0ABQ5USV6_9HYPH|nr:lipocalin-like domain-containing protein [Maritalea porphyrae]GLQ17444.1 hypothetical protein GCM10007879_16930 [Maritalea porphyrae]
MNASDLLGEWRLVSAELTTKGSTTSIYDPKWEFVKIFTQTHFAFLTRLPEDRAPFSAEATDAELLRGAKSFNAGGGRYDLAGADYIEHIQYCSYPNYEGQSIAFKLTFVDGVLTQEGIYPLKRLGFGDTDGYLVESYERL